MTNQELIFIKKYVALYKKAQDFGYNASIFKYKPAKLEPDNSTKKRKWVLRIIIILLIIFLFYFAVKNHDEIVYKIASAYSIKDECLVSSPSTSDLFLPIIDCSFCRKLSGEVERIEKVDNKVFEEKYAYSGLPVIVTDAASSWKAMTAFNIDFFTALYSNGSLPNDCQFFAYESKFSNLSEALHPQNFPHSKGSRQSWYFGW